MITWSCIVKVLQRKLLPFVILIQVSYLSLIVKSFMTFYTSTQYKIHCLVFLFLTTFMTFYTSTLYKIHCLVFSVPDDFHDILHQYSVQGYRIIALAYRQLDPKLSWHQAQRITRYVEMVILITNN